MNVFRGLRFNVGVLMSYQFEKQNNEMCFKWGSLKNGFIFENEEWSLKCGIIFEMRNENNLINRLMLIV